VRLVDDDILEAEFLKRRYLDETDLVARYADIEILRARDESAGDDRLDSARDDI
jgi:hypothetical protein